MGQSTPSASMQLTQNREEGLNHQGSQDVQQRELQALQLWRNNLHTVHQYRLGASQLESNLAGKDLEVPVDTKLTRSQQWILVAQAADSTLGCTGKSITSSSGEVIALFYSAQETHRQMVASPLKGQ